ncbi:hypothetical protein HHI36_008965 [Cryptolaemus montrouzieri]|uniref:Cystinosin n=1 Tax=Cryptolaemus montrouzieri TaxID=559131 RepID=A0ABD2MU42_9CUCU
MKIRNYESLLLLWITCITNSLCDVKISTHDVQLTVGDTKAITLEISNYHATEDITFIIQHDDLVDVNPKVIQVKDPNENVTINVKAKAAGHSDVYANNTNRKDLDDVYFRKKKCCRSKFRFLALNLIGFSLYSIFNIGLYCIDEIKDEYFNRYPRGLNPVQLNDIFFAVHAVLVTLVTIGQCFIYQRDEQRVSITARGIIVVFAVFLIGSTILTFTKVIQWLDLLYYCSYVKLTITLIKYVPQAYMNYKRKSTIGWSIGNIFLDFTGGTLSMLQMILNAYNYDDWISIFGDVTKFGLGLFSVLFDVFFIVQHYVLYRHTNYEENP